mgnify:CR=1 FL=1
MSQKEKSLTDEVAAALEEIVDDDQKPQKQKGETVQLLENDELMVGKRKYKLLVNYREGFDPQRLGERYSDVLAKYDYVVGDWGFEQLRLKGFFEVTNRKATPDQRIDTLEDYLYEFCNFGCAYFVIARLGEKRGKKNNTRPKKKKKQRSAHTYEKREVDGERKVKEVKNKPKKKNTKESEKKSHGKGFTIRKRDE